MFMLMNCNTCRAQGHQTSRAQTKISDLLVRVVMATHIRYLMRCEGKVGIYFCWGLIRCNDFVRKNLLRLSLDL